jgi:hypothetical protein
MNESASRPSLRIWNLILVPAVITLAVTILRLVGELEHWPRPWFDSSAGGGAAIVGISWLPFIFGPYFAWKLAGAGEGPSSSGKSIGAACGAVVLFVLGGFLFGATIQHPSLLTLLALVLELVAAFIPGVGWRALGNTLLAYAFAARIPVVIVMFIAMSANGGHGWGTHYDVVPPAYQAFSLARKFAYFALLPQMTLWIGWTVAAGALVGSLVVAIFRPGKRPAAAAA